MRLDPTTLSDLELLKGSDGAPGLIDLIDRTRTSRGRAALKRQLTAPSRGLDAARASQEAVRFFRGNPGLFTVHEKAIQAVERFLDTNLVTLTSTARTGRLTELYIRVRYPDVHREIRTGVRHTQALFESLTRTCERIDRRGPPPLVQGLSAKIRDAAREVWTAGAGAQLLAADRAYRFSLRDRILGALDAVGELDLWSSHGAFAASRDWVFPDLLESAEFLIDAEDVVHPFLEDGVGNPVQLSGGEPMLFLTGPNMAGKTTYLRTVGLLVILAQMGLPVPASRARITPVERVFTSLNPSDNLRTGISYFMAEVLRVREAAELLASGRHALILFDEVFKGTNVKDALEASAQVISGFARAQGSGFIFASHLAELARVLEEDGRIRFAYFDGDLLSGRPHYPYRLEAGVSEKRFGLVLMRQAGIPELLGELRP